MGHLINPVALRLGWTVSWYDSWYTDHIYYPELLHDVFRIRLYMNYFFTWVFFEKSALFFSHFEIILKYNFLILNVYYYDGIIMEGIYNFQADFLSPFSKRRFARAQRYGRRRRLYGARNARLFLSIFHAIFGFSLFFNEDYFLSSFDKTTEGLRFMHNPKAIADSVNSVKVVRKNLNNFVPKTQRTFSSRFRHPKNKYKGSRRLFFSVNKTRLVAWNKGSQFSSEAVTKDKSKGVWQGSSSHRKSWKEGSDPGYKKFIGSLKKRGLWATKKRHYKPIYLKDFTLVGPSLGYSWKMWLMYWRLYLQGVFSFARFPFSKNYSVRETLYGQGQSSFLASVKAIILKQRVAFLSIALKNSLVAMLKRHSLPAGLSLFSLFKFYLNNYIFKNNHQLIAFAKTNAYVFKKQPFISFYTYSSSFRYSKGPSGFPGYRDLFNLDYRPRYGSRRRFYGGRFFEKIRRQTAVPLVFAGQFKFVDYKNLDFIKVGVTVSGLQRQAQTVLAQERKNSIKSKPLHGIRFYYKRISKLGSLFRVLLRFCKAGSFGRVARFLRRFFAFEGSSLPLTLEFKIFFIFLVLFSRVWSYFCLRPFSFSINHIDFIEHFFFTISFLFFYNGIFFLFLSRFINCMIQFLVPHLSSKVVLFLLSNETLSARFISRFIGRRLGQGHRVRTVLSPIMEDLYRVARGSRSTQKAFLMNSGTLKGGSFMVTKPYRDSIVKSFVFKFFSIYRRLFGRFFKQHKSWINFYFYNFIVLFFNGYGVAKEAILIGAVKSLFLRKPGFLFFFNFDFTFHENDLSFSFNELFFDFSVKSLGFSLFFFFIFDDLFSNFSVIFFSQPWGRFRLDISFAATAFFFNRLLRQGYWKYNQNWAFEATGFNKRNLRFAKNLSPFSLMGFKVHLRGRFSRKQRASSVWYIRGHLPLNSLSANIDYGFSTIPLRNSLTSVKVWLYKESLYPQWYLRQL